MVVPYDESTVTDARIDKTANRRWRPRPANPDKEGRSKTS
jgi:hypothetical protein